MFQLLRFFVVTSVAAIVAVAVMMAVLWQYQVGHLVAFAESQNVALARSMANTLWPRYSAYVASAAQLSPDALKARPETREIAAALKTMSTGLPILKVKIYNMHGLTVFSSEPGQIGEDKSNNPGFFAAARQGRAASKLTFRGSFSTFEGVVHDRDLVESYLPIQRGDGPVEGVFELYTDVTPLLDNIKRSSVNPLAIFLVTFGILYGVLFLLVRRADGTIKRQYQELSGQNDVLEKEISHRRSIETDLQLARDELEQRVEERTRTLRAEIAERQRIEKEARKQRNELARVGGVLIMGEMATSLAHELNQPLSVISGNAQYCSSSLRNGGYEPERFLDAMDQIVEQADRANNVIRRVRSFMRKEKEEREVTDLNQTILNLGDLLQLNAKEHETAIELDLAGNLPPVLADPIQIQQVILNLAHNGMEAMNGTPVNERKLTIHTSGDLENCVEIAVRDQGTGVPKAILDQVFDPFFSTKRDGLGMGLAISRSIVEAHSGRLTATSDEGNGSVFRIILPAVRKGAPDGR